LGVLHSVPGGKQGFGGTPKGKIRASLNAVWVLNYGATNMAPTQTQNHPLFEENIAFPNTQIVLERI
jgi:hypothetical protein